MMNNSEATKRLLILDVDETLIYGSEHELDRSADFRVGPFHIYRRPYLDSFLKTMSDWFSLAVWSSASLDYVIRIANEICPAEIELEFIWGRERCIQRIDPESLQTIYIKDLSKVKRLGFDIRRILFVDDTPAKMQRNYGNAIYVSPFEGPPDNELEKLTLYLKSIRSAENYRTFEKRGWKRQLSQAKLGKQPE